MTFEIYDKNELIGMVLTDGYERVTRCEDCTYFDYGIDVGYCWYNDTRMQKYDYCSRARRKDKEK